MWRATEAPIDVTRRATYDTVPIDVSRVRLISAERSTRRTCSAIAGLRMLEDAAIALGVSMQFNTVLTARMPLRRSARIRDRFADVVPLMTRKREQADRQTPTLVGELRAAVGSVGRGELLFLVSILFMGVVLRLLVPHAMAVEHFDEGVYASNIWAFDVGGGYPNRHYYAPPLVPFLIEMSIILTGPHIGPLVPSLVAGCLTVAVVWIAARSWFGAAAAWPAVILAAASDVHILYSRTALTDVLLAGVVLLAVWLLSVAIARRRWDIAVLAGLATAVAWWTKYNGWLPIAIAICGIGLWMVCYRVARTLARSNLLVCAVMIATAVLCWLPYLWSLQSIPGGYASIAANHAGYVVGIAGWSTSLARQSCHSARVRLRHRRSGRRFGNGSRRGRCYRTSPQRTTGNGGCGRRLVDNGNRLFRRSRCDLDCILTEHVPGRSIDRAGR